MTGEESGNPESPEQDYKRMEALNRGDWCYLGLVAKAVIVSANGIGQTLRSAGLWGIESDSSEDYFASVEKDELAALRSELESFGFSARAITRAFQSLERKDA